MMKGRGFGVTLYAGEQNEAPCDELVTCITEAERAAIVGTRHYTEADWGHPGWQRFNANVIAAMRQRIQPHDFICVIGGYSHKPIADAFPNHLTVEFGIGYAGTFAKFRVFESYAWMRTIYGAQSKGNAAAIDGQWYDAVIPNQIDPALFPAGKGDGGYFLYVGRLIDRKGYAVAQDACKRIGARLILAGPGRASGYGEFVGEVGPEERARLMGGATAVFMPTHYIEPFGTVAIEAMACGAPVIATDWGAFTETIRPGFNGFRCRTLAEFCEAAVRAPELDREAIRTHALATWSMDAVAPLYEAYFDRLSTLWADGWYAAA
jgi:glycosyltransferase involved in cell wall biosynthesis